MRLLFPSGPEKLAEQALGILRHDIQHRLNHILLPQIHSGICQLEPFAVQVGYAGKRVFGCEFPPRWLIGFCTGNSDFGSAFLPKAACNKDPSVLQTCNTFPPTPVLTGETVCAYKTMTTNESTLAVRAAQDPAAFAELFDCFYGRVFNYARYRCDDDDTADDLAAQIFERVLTHIGQYAPEKGLFAPWLFALARNVINDHYRRAGRFRWATLDFLRRATAPDPEPEAHLIACEDERELLAALAGLEARERDVLGLKFAARLTNREIARTLGLGESNVGVIVYRALGKLREKLTE